MNNAHVTRRTWLVRLVILLAVSTFSANAHAAVLTSVADSYVRGNSADANQNFGTDTTLLVKNQSGTQNGSRISYIRFDDPLIGSPLVSSTLSLEFVDEGGGAGGGAINWEFEVYGLNDGDAGEAWGESTISWNNAPANSTTSNGILGNATSLGTFSFTGRTASIGFTGTGGTAVRDFVAMSSLDDLVTFIVIRNTAQPDFSNTYIHSIASREHATVSGPLLTVVAVPEPSAFCLLGTGLLGILTRRRVRRTK